MELRWSKFYLISLNTFWSVVVRISRKSPFNYENRNALWSQGMITFHGNIALIAFFMKGIVEASSCHKSFTHRHLMCPDKKTFEDHRSETVAWGDRKCLCPVAVEAPLSLRSSFRWIIAYFKKSIRSQGCKGKVLQPLFVFLLLLLGY